MKKLWFILMFSCFWVAQAQNEGDYLYDAPMIHDVYFNFTQTGYFDSLLQNKPLDKYMMCGVTIDGTQVDSVGIKMKGNSSFNGNGQKKSFKIDLNEYVAGKKYDGLKKFNLNNVFKDPSFLREKIALDFFREVGLPAPRSSYARVYLNGQYWGLYLLVEEINSKYLNLTFGENDGNLYKGDPKGDLQWFGNDTLLYQTKYEWEEMGANGWADLMRFIQVINQTPAASFKDSLDAYMDVPGFLKYWAGMNLFVNLDSYTGSGHNFYLYHNAQPNQMKWIAWDVNESFGNFKMNFTTQQLKNLSTFYAGTGRPLTEKMVQNAVYKQALADVMCDFMRDHWNVAKLQAKADSIHAAIQADVFADTKKTYTNTQFTQNLTTDLNTPGPNGGMMIFGIKPFIQARYDFLTQELASWGCAAVGINAPLPSPDVRIYPNPSQGSFTIENLPDAVATLTLTDFTGKILLQQSIHNNENIHCEHLSTGLYGLRIEFEGNRQPFATYMSLMNE